MNKEEILARSRQENRGKDEMERDTFARAGQRACAVGGLVCMAIIFLESIFADQVSCSTWAVYLSITGTMLLTKYTRLKKKHELIFGVTQLIIAAIFFAVYVWQLVR